MSQKTGRGERIAQARRLLGVVLHRDMPQKDAAAMIGKSGATWSRWESERDRPDDANLQAFIAICEEHGLTGITLAWINYGAGEGPPVIGKAPAKKEGRGAREGLHGERLARPSAVKKKRRSS